MQLNAVSKSFQLQDGREISIETGKLARQADGSVVIRMGNTMLLATVVSKKEHLEGADFLPLSVDYQEKFASAGRIPGGFLKREGKLSDYEVLVCRLVDRALRPMFPDDYHADTQVNIQLISADKDEQPDALAALAASSALAVSDIPFNGPISEVRVARIEGEFVVNPPRSATETADLELIVAATMENVIMVEGEMKEVSEEDMLEGIKVAHEAIKVQCQAQIELAELVGSTEKREYSHEVHDEDLKKRIQDELYDKVYEVVARKVADKKERSSAISAVFDEWVEALGEEPEEDLDLAKMYFKGIHKKAARNMTLAERVRLDGRQLDEVRPIAVEADFLPMAHGSSLFTRGETQSLTTVTLGTKLDEQMIDSALKQGTNKFILHYNFPGFSTGEVKPNRGPGRREVGHGNLAMRALKQVIPADEDNPYTIRVVSDILESNGSSSMATVCAGSMALMDAGVPTSGAVSGIAMGMISDAETGNFAVLSDILGDEDHLGDMDFKVAGTAKGLTATQMDIKVDGLSYEVLSQALEQSKRGRMHILDKMNEGISSPRNDLKEHAPRSVVVKIEKDMIGAVIGPGGKIVQEIQKETNTTVVIEETETHGTVNIFAVNKTDMDNAVNRVKAIASMPEVGETYTGKVKSIMPFGAFIEFMPNRDGLLHISEIKWERVETMEGVMKVGEEVTVKLIDIDKKTGKYRLSRKALLPRPERKPKN
ncbi:MAG TPA: polyribonucleotide nucleotidyltransferase [Cytophagales bacterium]|nr:polyribonucleotide nucleotidyltransferase [Cytophagales bacterium]HAP62839.1 polyribonucleotide nucleotidyltransferase [Cytophagales bacterium]